MTRTELVSAVAEKTGLSKQQTKAVVDEVFETIATELEAGHKVDVQNFGIFEPRERKARKGRNPATGEPMDIAASIQPAFRARKKLKERLNTK